MKLKFIFIAVIIDVLFLSTVAAQNINTIVGGLGDNGAATVGKLFNPNSVAVDKSGNIFIADYGNNLIRKIDAGGIITTVLSVTHPSGIAVDTFGNVFISDNSNHLIWKVDVYGNRRAYAGTGGGGWLSGDGGPATSANLNPGAIACDKSGNLYIADYGLFIRKVNTSGIISEIAGSATGTLLGDGGPATAASLNTPTGIAIDRAGNVFIADNGNNRVRKVDTSGTITTFAGNGTLGSAGDGMPATGANFNKVYSVAVDTSGNVYIADNGNNLVRKVNAAGIITRVAGTFLSGGFAGDGGAATSAQLNNPTGIAFDRSGNYYIADNNNNRIRKVNTTGTITTVAGCSFHSGAGYFGDGGPAISAVLNSPSGLAYDTAFNLYIADRNNNVIRKVNASGVITTFAGNDTVGHSGDGGPATSAKLFSPTSVTADRKGNLFICDALNNVVRKVSNTGIISTYAGNGTAGFSGDGHHADSASLGSPYGIACDKSGNLFIADRTNNRIRKVDTNGIITSIAGTGVAGYLGDGGPAVSSEISQPLGICLDKSGNLFFADQGNWRIRKIDTSGTITTVAGGGTGGLGGLAINASLSQPPVGVFADRTGNIFIAIPNSSILRVDTAGIISNFAGRYGGYFGDGGPALLAGISLDYGYPLTMVADTSGDILFPDTRSNRVRIIYDAAISISTPDTIICYGSGATFTATISAAPSYAPYYHWKKNGLPVGSNSPVYSAAGLNNGDNILCYITNGATGQSIATSNTVTITTVAPTALPALDISLNPGSNICAGTTVNCAPNSVVNQGAAPVYEWYRNGTHVFTGPSYLFVPVNGDIVYCKLISSISCLTVDTALSPTITFTVHAPGVATISIHAVGYGPPSASTILCNGTSVDLDHWSVTDALSETYDWYNKGIHFATGSSVHYTPSNGDSVYVKMTTLASCLITDTAISNGILFVVNLPGYPAISISSDQGDTVCPGTRVNCKATTTLGGSSPIITWYQNSVSAGSGATYSFTPSAGDAVFCLMTSNDNCVVTNNAVSNNLFFGYSVPVPDSVTIAVTGSDTVCVGASMMFTATPFSVGTRLGFDWYINGSKVFNGNPLTYTPVNGDNVYCALTSSGCVSPNPAISKSIKVTVQPLVFPAVTISVDPATTICSGVPVTCTATGLNEGSAPVYNWILNGSDVFTGNPFSFTPNYSDKIFCTLTSNAQCLSEQTVSSVAAQFIIDSLPAITITCTPGQVNFSGTAVTLTASVSGINSSYQLQWIKNSVPIPGATDYTYSSNSFSIWDSVSCTLTATGNCFGTVASNTLVIEKYHDMKLYPDPNNGDFIISGNNYNANSEPVSIRIYNDVGKLVYEKNASFDGITFYTDIRLSNELPPGVYLLHLIYDLQKLSFLFVVK